MKFSINKSEFHQAIQNIIGVIPVKTTVPILSNVLLDLQDNKLTLTGTDLEVSISTNIDVRGEEDGAVAIPAKVLNEIVRELPDIPLELTSDEDCKVSINTEKGFYKLSGDAKEDFPKTSIEDTSSSFVMESDRFKYMINKTLFAVSTDELRTTLMGVYLKVLENQLRLVATDGHRLVKVEYEDSFSSDFQGEAIIPTKALNLLLKNLQSAEQINVKVSDDHLIFELEKTVIYSKCIEGQFPNYERVIPVDNDKKLTVNRELISQSVRRVAIFSNSITHQIRLSFGDNMVNIQSEDIEFGGEAKESVEADYTSEAMEIGYNATYLLDILRHLDTDEVVFQIKDPTSAATVCPTVQNENEDLLMLLMPIRLNED